MPGTDPFLPLVERFEGLGLEYMITGSVATTFYGEPRLTHDVDLVVDLPFARLEEFRLAFPETIFYIPPVDVMAVEVRRATRGHFNIIESLTGLKADVYVAGRDPLHAWGLVRRRRIEIGGLGLWLAPPEYVIVRKLEFFAEGGSEKHRRDIAAVLACQGEAVDRAFIESEVRARGLGDVWRRALEELET